MAILNYLTTGHTGLDVLIASLLLFLLYFALCQADQKQEVTDVDAERLGKGPANQTSA